MIGLGAKYLTAAGFGRYKITAASLGNLFCRISWLTGATMQAILAAFGDDGVAVIKATNAYLNGIAAQGQAGKDKATALAGLINEDPMMVCSLGLEPQGVTMPIRWLVGDGASWVNTGIVPTTDTVLEMHIKIQQRVASHMVCFGSRIDQTDQFYVGMTFHLSNKLRLDFAGTRLETANAVEGTEYNIKFGKSYAIVNGTSYGTFSGSISANAKPMYIMAGNNDGSPQYGTGVIVDFAKLNSGQYNFAPFKSTTREGMVDIVNGTFHPNMGTGHFSVAYTRNGQPWTPSTP